MKVSTRNLLAEADSEQLLEILLALSDRNPNLDVEIEFLLHPKLLSHPVSYYLKLVKKAIDTNSWSRFPNKGVKGLEEMVAKSEFLEKIGNHLEAEKLASAILAIINRCQKEYNSQNREVLEAIKIRLSSFWELK